jgi:hypothetical protein
VRLHPYRTERVLSRSAVLIKLGSIAGASLKRVSVRAPTPVGYDLRAS